MAAKCHTMGPPQRPTPTPTPNPSRTRTHTLHTNLHGNILLPLRRTAILASPSTIPTLLHILHRLNIRHSFPPLRIHPLPPSLVTFRLLFPRSTPPLPSTAPNAKIHIRLPPTRNNIARSIRRLWNRSFRIQSTLPGYKKHTSNSGYELPSSFI